MDDIEEAPRNSNSPPKLHVLFPTGNRADYSITKMTTVSDLIKQITEDETIQKPENRTIALIYHGRILQPTEVISKIDSLDEFTIHVFYRQIQRPTTQEPLESDLRGFDRLTRMNYTADQIADFRRSFHTMHGSLNSPREEQIEAEEEWIPVIFNNETALVDLQLPELLEGRRSRRNGHGNANNNTNNTNNNTNNNRNNNGNHHNRRNENQNDANERDTLWMDTDEDAEGSSWMRFAFGFIIGIIFGITSIIFMLASLTDSYMLTGLFLGTCSHYFLSYYFRGETS
ncbi:hypothetical protein TRFO_13684 [Tritrichomonas foetus]|uniref:Ubiquitin-like domain-containing protein n=1 Tax=Tritrichomonas foetus TaxID=1144522 RepID=A0A1J4KXF6_9EUKA|nr:hypothetical protein TRFO_13684 [Tritrichomonas foetus]|eukprot:OHT15858.1 hypothetical protein TRFO_13684 [Tritrichomonas foetus]